MSGGEIAGLIAAGAFLLLVGVLAVPILKLGRTVDAATRTLEEVAQRTGPLLAHVDTTVDTVNTTLVGVNGQLAKVDTITGHAQQVSTNAASLSSLFAATLGGPLIKAAALSYGLRKAVSARSKADLEKEVRSRMKAERKARHRRGES